MDALDRYEPPRAWWDPLVTIGVGAAVYGLLALWSYPILHPSVWNEVAIAAGQHVPEYPFPGVYRALVQGLFHGFTPVQLLDVALTVLGRMAIAGASMCVYLGFRELLPALLLERMHLARVGMRMGRFCAVFVALLFACSDPVWRAGQTFSPVSLFLLLTTAAAWCLLRFLLQAKLISVYVCMVLLGVVAADSLLGMLFGVLTLAGVVFAAHRSLLVRMSFVNPGVGLVVRATTFKGLTALFGGVAVMTFAFNLWQLRLMDGMSGPSGRAVLSMLLTVVRDVWVDMRTAVTPVGWLFVLLFAVAPLVLTLKVLARARNEDAFLPLGVAVVAAGCGTVAFSQLVGVPGLCFWTWGGRMVTSDIVLAVVLALDVVTCALAVAIFGLDGWCRNYRRIAQRQFPESMQLPQSVEIAESLGRTRPYRMLAFYGIVVLAVVGVGWGRRQPTERGMLSLMGAYEEELMRETRACAGIFTDGAFDRWHRLMGLRQGNVPSCIASRKELRSWIERSEAALNSCAVQAYFELWKSAGLELPVLSGLAAFPGGVPPDELARARKASWELAEQVLEFQSRHDPSSSPDFELRAKYPFVLFRLARVAETRSWVASQAHRHDEAKQERARAEKLDAANYELAEFQRRVEAWKTRQQGESLNMREGLVIGLSRGDFAFAGKYASPILRKDPDDPRANFAVGMKWLQERNWARAEPYFQRALKRRPREATLLNNLAIIQLNLHRLDEAEAHARQALALQPKVPEIRRTLDLILKAKSGGEPSRAVEEHGRDHGGKQ